MEFQFFFIEDQKRVSLFREGGTGGKEEEISSLREVAKQKGKEMRWREVEREEEHAFLGGSRLRHRQRERKRERERDG